MVHSIISVLLLLVCLDAVDGYSTGPPNTVCSSMAPSVAQHGASPQSTPAPYNVAINVTDEGAKTGNSYTVSITSNPSTTFKGFMCQVRQNGGDTAMGNFTSFNTQKAKNLDCTSSKGAVVHRNGNVVSSFSATWEAPSSVSGNTQLIAYCTIVQVRNTYWVQVPSSPFNLAMSSTAAPPGQTSTQNTTTVPPPQVTTPTSGGTSVAVASIGILFLGLLLQISF